MKLIVNRGIFRLEGKEFSSKEDEIEKCGVVAFLKLEVTRSRGCVLPGASCQYAFTDQLLWGYRPCPEFRGEVGLLLLSPRLLSSCKGRISRDIKPKELWWGQRALMDTGEARDCPVVGPALPSSGSTETLEWEQRSGILKNPADTPNRRLLEEHLFYKVTCLCRVPIESYFSNSCRLRKEGLLWHRPGS